MTLIDTLTCYCVPPIIAVVFDKLVLFYVVYQVAVDECVSSQFEQLSHFSSDLS